MARPRSLIVGMEITVVGRAHNCRQSDNHRLEKGMKRLTVKSDGDEHHYCLACAKTFLLKDIERFQTLLAEVNSHGRKAAASDGDSLASLVEE